MVPRKVPREEQLIRARRASELGVVDFVDPEMADDPAVLARALLALPTRRKPSQVDGRLQLEGLDAIAKLVSRDFRQTRGAALTPN